MIKFHPHEEAWFDIRGTCGSWTKREKRKKMKYFINFLRTQYFAVSSNTSQYFTEIIWPNFLRFSFSILCCIWQYFKILYRNIWLVFLEPNTLQYLVIPHNSLQREERGSSGEGFCNGDGMLRLSNKKLRMEPFQYWTFNQSCFSFLS